MVPIFRRQREAELGEFQDSQGYTEKLHLGKKEKKMKIAST